MEELKVGDIVRYKDRLWYLYSLYSPNLCQIVAYRDGKYTHLKHFRQGNYEWTEEYLNANIVNLPVEEINKI